MHDLSIIVTLTGALAVALVCGWATQRIGLTTLVGYLIAGVLVGPHTPGFVADPRLAAQMAEIGVILLMFGVGMHFHPQDLLRVWRIAVPGALAQSAVAGVTGWAAARAFGWSDGAGIVFGMALAVASTVVLMRMLVERDRLGTRDGHVAVGWLVVEDFLTVIALVVLPVLASGRTTADATAAAIATALGKAAIFAVLVWAAGTRLVAPAIERIARTRSTELFTLTVFVVALGVALLAAEVFAISVALGAFFGGLVVGQSRFGTQAAADMVPFRDVFSALFFVSVGMLFNPAFVMEQPLTVLAAIAIVLVAKPLTALVILLVMRDTPRTCLTVAVGLAQIGEFSFMLGMLGSSLGVLPPVAMDALVAAAIASIAVNPLLFRGADALERRLRPAADEDAPAQPGQPRLEPPREAPVVIAGGGPLARRLARRCLQTGLAVRTIDKDAAAVATFQEEGIAAVVGDSGEPAMLREAGVAQARVIVVTVAELSARMRTCRAARKVNPRIAVVAMAQSSAERAWLEEFGAAFVCDALDEMTESLLRAVRGGL